MSATAPLIVSGLRATVGDQALVEGIDLTVAAGECVALVGPSGSGKTVTARAILGLSDPTVRVEADSLQIAGTDVRNADERAWRRVRGRLVGYVGQEALGALDPLRPVGREIEDALRLHTERSAADRRTRVREALRSVGLDAELATNGALPGALSGGMRQRALIAAAIVTDPALIIADEPTTALDASVALRVMRQLRDAQSRGAGLLVITHDDALVDGWADRVLEIRAGRLVPPTGATRSTRIVNVPAALAPPAAVQAAARADAAECVLRAASLQVELGGRPVLADVSFEVRPGHVLGVVGASGSGKTTLTRVLLGLTEPTRGTVELAGQPWLPLPERDRRGRRSRIAAVVQDPAATFDPRWSVERVIVDALSGGRARRARAVDSDPAARTWRGRRGSPAAGARRSESDLPPSDAAVDAALRRVGLDPAMRPRSPRTLSGGQRQRLAIARALATEPLLLILDEPVTALDARVQDAVLDLLEQLRATTGVAMVFVSHDLAVVRRMADDVLVIDGGRVVERGPTSEVLTHPAHPVTAGLVRDARLLADGAPVRGG
ncbi:ABC transporter ATP-binding protein [Curtobacterium ammoniigenes]|uniref:ABC transporter ATP-binding protein n=1 Tax=Curtobacterium ammoniigenes TaxID=395387 RepID=UPI0008342BF1|nr:ATP-binding cassette domain-containing protein [Curtobacterium ammoniigenes]